MTLSATALRSIPRPLKSTRNSPALSRRSCLSRPPAADIDLFLTLRLFDPDGREVTFVGANDPRAPISQGWLRVSHRKTDRPCRAPISPTIPMTSDWRSIRANSMKSMLKFGRHRSLCPQAIVSL